MKSENKLIGTSNNLKNPDQGALYDKSRYAVPGAPMRRTHRLASGFKEEGSCPI